MPEIKTSYPQEPVLLEDRYPATLKEVSEYTATYEGKETEKLAWIFDVEAPEDAIDPDVEIEIEDWRAAREFALRRLEMVEREQTRRFGEREEVSHVDSSDGLETITEQSKK